MSADFLGGIKRKKDNSRKHPQRDEAIKARKQGEALRRTLAWVSLSPQEQLRELDRRLGAGVGASRQRAKLAKAVLK